MENKSCGPCVCPVTYKAVECALVKEHNQGGSAHAPALRAHDQNPQAHLPAFQKHNEDETAHQELFARKADKVQLQAHVGNQDIHVDAADRQRWDGKADAAQLQAHVGNQEIHVNAADKQRWDGKVGTEQFDEFKRLCLPGTLELYLSPTGVDAPDRGSKERPLRSIQYATGHFSNSVNAIALHLAEGTYGDGSIMILAHKGYVAIYGPASGPANCVINGGFNCQYSQFFSLSYVTLVKPADAIGINVTGMGGDIGHCLIEGGGGGIGVQILFGHARVNDCTINNCGKALYAWLDSHMTAYSNLGTGNQHGIYVTGGVVLTSGVQPAAALPNHKDFSGQIFE